MYDIDYRKKIVLFTEIYLNDIKAKVCNQNVKPKILKETAATAWVDGQNGLGPVVGNFCMDLCIRKAKESGIGWVVAKGEKVANSLNLAFIKIKSETTVPLYDRLKPELDG